MTKPLSLDLRQRVIAAIEARMSCRAAAARFGIAPSAAVKWRRLWLETGSVAPRAQGGDTRSGRIEAAGPAILAMVSETPDITLVEIAERLEREHGERFAPCTVHRFFRRHGWSFKKKSAHASEQDRADVAAAREAWFKAQPDMDPEAAGAELRFLPPYSPDLNPIENAFAKVKALLRKAAARTRNAIWSAVATAIETFARSECANYFAAAGYEPEW